MIFALTISIFWTFDQFQHGDHAGNENGGDGASEDDYQPDASGHRSNIFAPQVPAILDMVLEDK